jgi:membrane protein implicated in regulation of membrane protease activity
MSNKINTTTGNEVKDMNTTELEGKASSSTSQSGGMSNATKFLVLAIANLITMGIIVANFIFVMPGAIEDVAAEGVTTETVLIVIAAVLIVLLAIAPEVIAKKRKKDSETSTEEQSAEVVKTEEVTSAEDEKPSNGLSNSAKFLMLGLSIIVITAFMGYVFALLR